MRKDKCLAIKLRREGESYNDIEKKLKIPKSTLSSWFSNIKWSEEIKEGFKQKTNCVAYKNLQRFNKERKEKWERLRRVARQEAQKDFLKLIKNPLFIAGLMLYWGEGDSKTKNPIRLSNTDPRMISSYIKFLVKCLNIPKEKLRSN